MATAFTHGATTESTAVIDAGIRCMEKGKFSGMVLNCLLKRRWSNIYWEL